MSEPVQQPADAYDAIRSAVTEDLQGVLLLQRSISQNVDWSERVWRQVLDQSMHQPSQRCVWLAEATGCVVGYAVASRVLQVCELEMLAVAPQMRRRGVGRALCEAAIKWAQENGVVRMELEVRASNGAALQLYDSLQFSQSAVRTRYYRDPVEDAVLLARSLSPEDLRPSKV